MNDTLTKIALHKAVKDKEFKQYSLQLEPGEYPVKLRVEVVGMLKKGEPYEQRIAAKANPWALLARALSKLNGATVESLVKESLSVSAEEAEAIKESASDALRRIIDATKSTVSGQITGVLTHREL